MSTNPHINTPGTTTCIFCGAQPTNKEHVFPAWSHRYIKKRKGKWRGLRGVEFLGREEKEEVKGLGDIHDWQVKCVCEFRCNNGWMRERLENQARPFMVPMIEGKPCHLTSQQQRIVAGWACLKAIIGEYQYPNMTTWDADARERMMRLRLPPAKDCAIWLGHYKRVDWDGHWLTFPMKFLPGRANRERFGETITDFNSAATTQIIGQLLIHIVHAPRLRRLSNKPIFVPQIQTKLRQIWPISGHPLSWPPDTLDDKEAEYVSHALFRKIERAAARIIEISAHVPPP